MSLIISENGQNAERLSPSGFDQENYLQQYIYKNPDAVPVYEIDEDIRLLMNSIRKAVLLMRLVSIKTAISTLLKLNYTRIQISAR